MNIDKETIQALKERAKEMLNNDYSRKIGDEEIHTIICEWENTLSELETYKKIAEKLAEEVKRDSVFYDKFGICSCDISEEKHQHCSKHNNGASCIQCIIDWARKEVEKDE